MKHSHACNLRFTAIYRSCVPYPYPPTIVQVGYDLTAGLPGHFGIVTVEATGGDYNVSVISGQSSFLEAGLFIDLDGEAYEINSIDTLNETITLVEVCRLTRITRGFQ